MSIIIWTYLYIDQSSKTSEMIIDMGYSVEACWNIFHKDFGGSSMTSSMGVATTATTSSTTKSIVIKPGKNNLLNDRI